MSEGRKERNPMARKRQMGTDARAVLALLPPTENKPDWAGAYVGEIAEDLLHRHDSIARSRIRGLLLEIDSELGYLRRHKTTGPAVYGQKVSYSVPEALWPKVVKLLAKGYPEELKT